DQRATMRAAVLEGIELAVRIPGDDDRGVADKGSDEVAGVLYLDRQAEIVPGGPLEDALLLGAVDVLVLKDPVRHAGHAIARRNPAGAVAVCAGDLIQHETSRGERHGC